MSTVRYTNSNDNVAISSYQITPICLDVYSAFIQRYIWRRNSFTMFIFYCTHFLFPRCYICCDHLLNYSIFIKIIAIGKCIIFSPNLRLPKMDSVNTVTTAYKNTN